MLFVFDATAFLMARELAGRLQDPVLIQTASGVALAGPLASPGGPASLIFPVVLLLSLLTSGSYSRHRPIVLMGLLLVSVAAAAVATALALASLIGVPRAFAHIGVFGLVCYTVLAAGRALSQRFVLRVWPRNWGALPAVRLSTTTREYDAQPRNWGDYAIVEQIQISSTHPANDLPAALNRLEEIAMTGGEAVIATGDIPDDALVPVVHSALDLGYRIIFPARAVEIEGIRPRLIWQDSEPFFEITTPMLRASAQVTKRVFDVVTSSALLLLAAPLVAVIALCIRLDSAGPVLFTQDRAGLGGRRFRMLKFRTMKVGADAEKQHLAHLNRSGDTRLFKIPSDPRVTRVGAFLRRWSLDELPQLINVLKGEMSLVGPRPFFEADFAAYEDRHFRRLDSKPGLTGLWQVSGRSDVVDFEDVIFLDRQYIEQWSIWLDLSILTRTIPAVLRRDGAY